MECEGVGSNWKFPKIPLEAIPMCQVNHHRSLAVATIPVTTTIICVVVVVVGMRFTQIESPNRCIISTGINGIRISTVGYNFEHHLLMASITAYFLALCVGSEW